MWLVLAVAFIAAVLVHGFRSLSGSAVRQRVRPRGAGLSDEDWLLGAEQKKHCELGLSGLLIRCSRSAAAATEWLANSPPLLASDGSYHLYGLIGPWLQPDIVIRPPPVVINASAATVWSVLIDFASYPEWNPFHRKVEVVEQLDVGTCALRMTCN
jgi:hypothetical protein